MTQWELFKRKLADCNDSASVAACVREMEINAKEYCTLHMPDLVQFYKSADLRQASIYGLEAFLRTEITGEK